MRRHLASSAVLDCITLVVLSAAASAVEVHVREFRSGRDLADDDEAGAFGIEDKLGQAFMCHA